MQEYYNFKYSSDKTMKWINGQPCSFCGKPTELEHHRFEGGGKIWDYFAPLYHNVFENLGFCGPKCVMNWIKDHEQGNKQYIVDE